MAGSLLQLHGAANADIDVAGFAVEILLVFVGNVVRLGGEAVAESWVTIYLDAKLHHHLAAVAHLSILVPLSIGLVSQRTIVASEREFAVLIPLDQIDLHQSADFA